MCFRIWFGGGGGLDEVHSWGCSRVKLAVLVKKCSGILIDQPAKLIYSFQKIVKILSRMGEFA